MADSTRDDELHGHEDDPFDNVPSHPNDDIPNTDEPIEILNDVEEGNEVDDLETDSDPDVENVLHELSLLNAKKQSSAWNSLLLLGVSLILFAMVGMFRWEMRELGVLILVLIVHEFGHFLGMNIFGYRDVKMFFIPFFGAAVSGKSLHVAAWKKSIVLLLGPVPGIFIGLVLTIVNTQVESELLQVAANLFLFINAFNLLPILPLDGGQLVHLLIFCRNRHAEWLFRLVAAVALIGLGWLLSGWFLLILGVGMLISCGYISRINSIADGFRKEWDERILNAIDQETPPREIAVAVHGMVCEHIPAASTGKPAAQAIQNVWERLKTKPPNIFASLLLLMAYGGSIVLPIVTLIAFAFLSASVAVVEVTKPDGTKVLQEQTTSIGQILQTIDVSDDNLYHGNHVRFHPGPNSVIAVEGQWQHGNWHGKWKFFDTGGNLQHTAVFEGGAFVSYQNNEQAGALTDDVKNMDPDSRSAWEFHRQNAPQGPARSD